MGGFVAGAYAYLCPYTKPGSNHGYVARILLTDFSGSGVSYLNLQDTHSSLKGYQGGFASANHACMPLWSAIPGLADESALPQSNLPLTRSRLVPEQTSCHTTMVKQTGTASMATRRASR